MPKPELIIRKQNSPTRCEICHQSDQFDPATNQCLRCALVKPATDPPSTLLSMLPAVLTSTRSVAAAITGIMALFLCIFFWRVSMIVAAVAVLLGNRELAALRQSANPDSPPGGMARINEAFAYIGIYGGTLAGLVAIAICFAGCWLIH